MFTGSLKSKTGSQRSCMKPAPGLEPSPAGSEAGPYEQEVAVTGLSPNVPPALHRRTCRLMLSATGEIPKNYRDRSLICFAGRRRNRILKTTTAPAYRASLMFLHHAPADHPGSVNSRSSTAQ